MLYQKLAVLSSNTLIKANYTKLPYSQKLIPLTTIEQELFHDEGYE